MLRGKHGNEEEIKHRASADTSDSRTMGDVNGKFDLGGSAPASFRLYLRMSCHSSLSFHPVCHADV
jgi:hypothetical protein